MNHSFVRFLGSKARAAVALGMIAGLAFVTRLAIAQPHGETHPSADDPSAAHVAAEAPEAKGHENAPAEHGAAEHGAAEHGAAEHGAAEHGAAEHGAAHHGPAPINWTDLSDKHRPAFIGLLVNFGLLVALYYTLGKKPVTEGLKQRRVNIGKDIDEARKMLEEAKERAKKYQADLKNADTDAATAKTALVTAGKGEVDRLLIETEERAARMKRDAERLVEQERKQLQMDLQVETVNLAMVEAQKILERGTTPEDHARLANELLAELARKPAAPRVVGARVSAPSEGGAT